jgi:hypothetical protein
MLGVERCRQEGLEASLVMLSATSFGSSGSSLAMLLCCPFCPEPASRGGFSLAHDDRPFPSGHYGVTVPDLPLQHLAEPSSSPFGLRLLADPVCSGVGDLNTAFPLPDSGPAIPGSPQISASPSGLAYPSGSVRSIRFAAGKLAFRNVPISRYSPLSVRLLRIMAPGPLRFRRLAVPQISWNQFHSAPR